MFPGMSRQKITQVKAKIDYGAGILSGIESVFPARKKGDREVSSFSDQLKLFLQHERNMDRWYDAIPPS